LAGLARMTHIPERSQSGTIKSVGYLVRGRDYSPGDVSEEVFDRRAKPVTLHIVQRFGDHNCHLDPCGSKPHPRLSLTKV
jgi:hypothetical protein